MLNPLAPRLSQFLSYQFLHQDLTHLLGNMIFLWAFGNNVEDRLGKIGYLLFYLGGGVVAGIGHSLGETAPVLGASGSVAAVTGAFLVLFPNTRITLFYWLIIFGFFEIASMIVIGIQIFQNLFMQLFSEGTGSAYLAHLSGYAFGIFIAGGLLGSRLLVHEPYDLMGMYQQRRRRMAVGTEPEPVHTVSPGAPLRQQTLALLQQKNLPRAAEVYADLLAVDPSQVLTEPQQLDIANQLMADGRYSIAARAYELYLDRFGSHHATSQVQLLLGLIYTRYLPRRQRARELLLAAQQQLEDAAQQTLVRQLFIELEQPQDPADEFL